VIYHLYELHRAALAPVALAAFGARQFYGGMPLPLAGTDLGRALEAMCHLVERGARRYRDMAFDIDHTTIGGRRVAVREVVVQEKSFCALRRFERETGRADPKVLLVAPLSGHFPALLRETVAGLLPDHDVYVTDWIDARQVPVAVGAFGLEENIAYLLDFIRLLGPDLHVIGISQSAVPALCATALLAADGDGAAPRSLTLMAGPIDIGANPSRANKVVLTHAPDWYERTLIATVPLPYPAFMRRVLPGFVLLTAFTSMHLDRHLDAHFTYFQNLVRGDGESAEAHRRFYDRYLSVMDLTAEFFLDTVKTVFRDTALARGTMAWRGRPVEPRAIRETALLTVEGGRDDVAAPGQTYAAHALCPEVRSGARDHLLVEGVGHFGTFHGRRWRGTIRPRIRGFIRDHR